MREEEKITREILAKEEEIKKKDEAEKKKKSSMISMPSIKQFF